MAGLGSSVTLYRMRVRTALPEVRQITNVRTICETLNQTPATKTLLGEINCTQTLKTVFDSPSGIGEFRARLFNPQTTKDLPEDYHETRPLKQLSDNVLPQIHYGHP